MTGRMIHDKLFTGNTLKMPMGARMLLVGMIVNADGQGRQEVDTFELWRNMFVVDQGVGEESIDEWLSLLANNETIILYESDGKRYAQFVNWWEYQNLTWGSVSEYPPPEGWMDRIRMKPKGGNKVVTFNWTTKDGRVIPDTCDALGIPTPSLEPHNNGVQAPKENDPPVESDAANADSSDGTGDNQDSTTPPPDTQAEPIEVRTYVPSGYVEDKKEERRSEDITTNTSNEVDVNASPPDETQTQLSSKQKPKPRKKTPPTAYVNEKTGIGTNEIKAAYIECVQTREENPVLNHAQIGKGAKAIAQAGQTPEGVRLTFDSMAMDAWWNGKSISIQAVAKNIGAVMARANGAKANANQQANTNQRGSSGMVVHAVPESEFPDQGIYIPDGP